jgi:hypothetical protein
MSLRIEIDISRSLSLISFTSVIPRAGEHRCEGFAESSDALRSREKRLASQPNLSGSTRHGAWLARLPSTDGDGESARFFRAIYTREECFLAVRRFWDCGGRLRAGLGGCAPRVYVAQNSSQYQSFERNPTFWRSLSLWKKELALQSEGPSGAVLLGDCIAEELH